jgi:hypothetical protein
VKNATERIPAPSVAETEYVPFRSIRASDLIECYPTLRDPVIDGLLRRGEVMNVVAAPKVRKSWLVHALAIAAAQGAPWMGFNVAKCGVLLIDGELHPQTLAHRMRAVGESMLATHADLDLIEVWPRRGARTDIHDIAEAIERDGVGGARIIIIDALYRFLPIGAEENSNEAVTMVYNVLDALAARTGSAVVVVHHASKGDQSGKSVTDVGSGAGSQSRAADSHLVLRAHEEEGAVVVDAVVRSFAPIEPYCMRFKYPRWERADDLDPADLYRPGRKRRGVDAEPGAEVIDWTPEAFGRIIVGDVPSLRDEVLGRARERGLTIKHAERLLRQAVDGGHAHRHVDGPCSPHRFSTVPPGALC